MCAHLMKLLSLLLLTQYLTLCDSMNCSTPGFLVFHYLPELAHIQVHWVNDVIQPSHCLPPTSPNWDNFCPCKCSPGPGIQSIQSANPQIWSQICLNIFLVPFFPLKMIDFVASASQIFSTFIFIFLFTLYSVQASLFLLHFQFSSSLITETVFFMRC